MQAEIHQLLTRLLPVLPPMLVCLIGATCALVTMRKHLTVSLLTLAATCLAMLSYVVGIAFPWLLSFAANYMIAGPDATWFLLGFTVVIATLRTVSLALLVWAVFAQRGTAVVAASLVEGKP